MFVNNLQAAALPAMGLILVLGFGLSGRMVGLIGSIPRIFDAVSDPLMGYVSDNTRSRWGRRRPYIFVGAVLSGIAFAAMWQLHDGLSQGFYFAFFLVASVLFFLIYTVYATPFVALGYELTDDYHQRTRLHAWANSAGLLAWIAAPWFYKFVASNRFATEVEGARCLAIIVGVTIVILGVVPALFCREPKARNLPQRGGGKVQLVKSTMEFAGSFVDAFRCAPFVKLCASTFLVFNGYQLGVSFAPYIIIYYVYSGGDQMGAQLFGEFGSLTAALTLLVIPMTAWLASRLGKQRAFLITISLSVVGYAMMWIGYDPDHPRRLLWSCPLVAFGTGSLFTLMGSMISDVCDYDELQTGQRREGMFGAIYWWMVKVGMAIAGLLGGLILDWTGFRADNATVLLCLPLPVKISLQPESTMYWLRVSNVAISVVTSLVALGVMATYSLSESKLNEIRLEIAQRRKVDAASDDPQATPGDT